MEEIFLPVLRSFINGNTYTGSLGEFRYKITPILVMIGKKEVNIPESTIKAECWHGIFCYEKSTVEDSAVFPMVEDSRNAIRAWLEAHI